MIIEKIPAIKAFLNSRLEEQENPSVFDITAYQGLQQITSYIEKFFIGFAIMKK